jgi:phosphocarrier protein
MKSFNYVIKDSVGIHARPAGNLVKEAKKYQSKITVVKDGKSAEATKLMALMGLGVKCGNTVTVNVEGVDEEVAYSGIQQFFEANL